MGGHKSTAAEAGKYDLSPAAMLAFQAFSEDWAREAFRVLKPGGYLLTFASTRTYHRMTCGVEAAGFEIRDQIGWVFGSGFPKSHNGPWGGTALKPAWEPICVARKPLIGTVEANWQEHGTGALNIDGCRVGTNGEQPKGSGDRRGGSVYAQDEWTRTKMANGGNITPEAGRWPANLIHDGSDEVVALFPREAGAAAPVTVRNADKFRTAYGAFKGDRDEAGSTFQGDSGSAARFFAQFPQEASCQNQSSVLTAHAHSSLQSALANSVQDVVAIWPSLGGIASSDLTGRSTPVTPSESRTIRELVTTVTAPIGSESSRESRQEKHSRCGSLVKVAATRGLTGTTTITASLCRSDGSVVRATYNITPTSLDLGEAGSARRFIYCAKASKRDRNEGCEHIAAKQYSHDGRETPIDNAYQRNSSNSSNSHPTVKPTDLMRYLCRLVTPAGGLILDPFMGSGSTGRGAVLEGFRFIGIEREAEYIDIARARIDSARRQGHQPDLLEQAA